MVERSLSMREVPGSIPGASTEIFLIDFEYYLCIASCGLYNVVSFNC